MYFEAACPAGTFSLFEVSGNSVNQKFQLVDQTRQILRLDQFLSELINSTGFSQLGKKSHNCPISFNHKYYMGMKNAHIFYFS